MWKPKHRVFDPNTQQAYRISRSGLEMFTKCPRCFYLDKRLAVKRPSWPAFTLNIATDLLFKKELDIHRSNKEPHPLMTSYGIDAIPFEHKEMDNWRNNFKGVQRFHSETNFMVFGAVDDIWVTPNKILVVVDYKSTSTVKKIDLNDKWKQAYKRQMDIYQWLLRGNKDLISDGYRVSDKGFFVYANARKDEKAFDAKLEFNVEIIPYVGDDSWVEQTVIDAHKCLVNDKIPGPDQECEYCNYRETARKVEV